MELFATPANYEMRYNLHSIGSNGEGVADLELAGPKGPRRIVDETAGEVTFVEHALRIKARESQNNSPCTPQIM